MARNDMAEFMARVLVNEGCWVIEPLGKNGGFMEEFLKRLRMVPARIYNPAGTNRFKFAERKAEGKWFIVWVDERI